MTPILANTEESYTPFPLCIYHPNSCAVGAAAFSPSVWVVGPSFCPFSIYFHCFSNFCFLVQMGLFHSKNYLLTRQGGGGWGVGRWRLSAAHIGKATKWWEILERIQLVYLPHIIRSLLVLPLPYHPTFCYSFSSYFSFFFLLLLLLLLPLSFLHFYSFPPLFHLVPSFLPSLRGSRV